jgi:hypothetical protein
MAEIVLRTVVKKNTRDKQTFSTLKKTRVAVYLSR